MTKKWYIWKAWVLLTWSHSEKFNHKVGSYSSDGCCLSRDPWIHFKAELWHFHFNQHPVSPVSHFKREQVTANLAEFLFFIISSCDPVLIHRALRSKSSLCLVHSTVFSAVPTRALWCGCVCACVGTLQSTFTPLLTFFEIILSSFAQFPLTMYKVAAASKRQGILHSLCKVMCLGFSGTGSTQADRNYNPKHDMSRCSAQQ